MTELGLESVLIVPLVLHEKSLGELMVGSRKTDLFNDYDLQVVKTAAGQLAAAIESSHLVSQTDESLRRRVDQLTSVARVGREMGASLSIEDLLHVIHRETLRATGADCGSIILLDPGHAEHGQHVQQFEGCPSGAELTALDRTAIEFRPAHSHRGLQPGRAAPPHEGIRTALVVPISLRGKVLGLIELHAAAPAAFDEGAVETTQTLAIQAAISLNNARQYHEEREQANFYAVGLRH